MVKVDCFASMVTNDVPNLLCSWAKTDGGRREFMVKGNREMLKDLQNAGVAIEITNRPGMLGDLSFAYGRNHKKIFVVDDCCYLGGLNLSQSVFEREDFMVKITDNDIVEQITSIFEANTADKSNRVIVCAPDTELLMDVGSGHSVVMDRAIGLINSSIESVNFMSSRAACGRVRTALLRAVSRGVKVKTFSSNKDTRATYESYSPRYGRTHAKLIIADNVAIFGSHNFDWKLVTLKTEELSLQTCRQSIVEPLTQYFENTVKRSGDQEVL